ncbi:hypothetical protein VTO42DRAFT_2416 [Malbranchea cinnamomea]
MLRKELSYEHYYPEKFGDKLDAQHKAQIGHCVDLLAQTITCASSIDMILFNWVEGWDKPLPDFSNRHAMKKPAEGYVRLPEPGHGKPPMN